LGLKPRICYVSASRSAVGSYLYLSHFRIRRTIPRVLGYPSTLVAKLFSPHVSPCLFLPSRLRLFALSLLSRLVLTHFSPSSPQHSIKLGHNRPRDLAAPLSLVSIPASISFSFTFPFHRFLSRNNTFALCLASRPRAQPDRLVLGSLSRA
jgi:hypothetical protein